MYKHVEVTRKIRWYVFFVFFVIFQKKENEKWVCMLNCTSAAQCLLYYHTHAIYAVFIKLLFRVPKFRRERRVQGVTIADVRKMLLLLAHVAKRNVIVPHAFWSGNLLNCVSTSEITAVFFLLLLKVGGIYVILFRCDITLYDHFHLKDLFFNLMHHQVTYVLVLK